MSEKEIAKILLEADSKVLSISQIESRLSSDVSHSKISRDIRSIAGNLDASYQEWLYNSGNYSMPEVRKYEREIREQYGIEATPDTVRTDLRELGLLD